MRCISNSCELWQGIITIAQIPNTDSEQSWLWNPFEDDTVYTSVLNLNLNSKHRSLSWEFIVNESTKENAELKASYLLNRLRTQFPGLDGTISTTEITSDVDVDEPTHNHARFYEIRLPEKPYTNKITLFEKIWSIFSFLNNKSDEVISFFFQWQKDDSIPPPKDGNKDFKLNVYFTISSNSNDFHTRNQATMLYSYLEYMLLEFKNDKGEPARIIPAPKDTWKRIIEERSFYKNVINGITGARYLEFKQQHWMPGLIPNFITPEEIDFNIPQNIPIQKAVGLINENANLNSNRKGIKLNIGDYINRYGVQTQIPMYIHLDDLIRHMYINGLTRSGKSYLLASLLSQLWTSGVPVGVLIILLRKGNEKYMFHADQYLEYPNFKIPYFFSNDILEEHEKSAEYGVSIKDAIDDVSLMTTASVGLKDIFYTNCCNAFNAYIKQYGHAPKKFGKFCYHFQQWFEKKKYDGEFGINSVLTIENRFYKVKDTDFENVVELAHQLPDWFLAFLNGQKIVLDFTSCSANNYRIKLLLNFLFHMLKLFIPQSSTNTLKYLVCIDEAEFIAKNYHSYDPYDNEVIAQGQMRNIIEEIIESFGSRGLGLILTGKDARDLFNCIRRAGIVLLFTTDIQTAALFVNHDDQLALSKLPPRTVCNINRNTKEIYLFRTAEFKPQNKN